MNRWVEWFLVFVVCVGTAGQSNGGVVIFLGTTENGLLWNRPSAGSPPIAPVSGIGTAVPFAVQEFTVAQTGLYDFLSTSVTPSSWDNNLYLYETSFNSATPLNNVVVGSDDFPDVGLSGFNGVNLVSATSYFLVTTGFSNQSTGSYSNSISGPGDIVLTPVPEPTSLAMCGLGAFFTLLRRRRSTALFFSKTVS
jgi:PEP-CTERM motif